jgi:DNA replication protein DnaC
MSAIPDFRQALTEGLIDLHLPTVRHCYEETARRAEQETLSYEQYLAELVSRECDERKKNRTFRLLRESQLPEDKTLGSFDLKRLPARVGRQLRPLLDGSFLDRRENLLVFGNPGSGKTHLLCAIAQELIVKEGRRIHLTTCALLVQELLAAKHDLKLSRTIKTLARHEGLIIGGDGLCPAKS